MVLQYNVQWFNRDTNTEFKAYALVQCNVECYNRETNRLRHTQIFQCNVEWFDGETNDLRHTQIVQCNVEWFNRDRSRDRAKQMVLREIKWLRMTYNCWRRNHQKLGWNKQFKSDVMFFIHKHDKWREKVLTIPLRALSWTGPFDFTTNCKSAVSCAVKFLYVCPFLHHRLPFRQISKTMCFVGRFCCFKICSFHAFARSPHAWHHIFFFFLQRKQLLHAQLITPW